MTIGDKISNGFLARFVFVEHKSASFNITHLISNLVSVALLLITQMVFLLDKHDKSGQIQVATYTDFPKILIVV